MTVTLTGVLHDVTGAAPADVRRMTVTTQQRVALAGSVMIVPRTVDLPVSTSVSITLEPGPALLTIYGRTWTAAYPLIVSPGMSSLADAVADADGELPNYVDTAMMLLLTEVREHATETGKQAERAHSEAERALDEHGHATEEADRAHDEAFSAAEAAKAASVSSSASSTAREKATSAQEAAEGARDAAKKSASSAGEFATASDTARGKATSAQEAAEGARDAAKKSASSASSWAGLAVGQAAQASSDAGVASGAATRAAASASAAQAAVPVWRDAYASGIAYAAGSIVAYQGGSWYATAPVLAGTAPPAAPWQLLAAKGEPGKDGTGGPSSEIVVKDDTGLGVGVSVDNLGGGQSVVVGRAADADHDGTAVGYRASSGADGAAFGKGAVTDSGVALGANASAMGAGAVAIGPGATARNAWQIAIGGTNHDVVVPGRLSTSIPTQAMHAATKSYVDAAVSPIARRYILATNVELMRVGGTCFLTTTQNAGTVGPALSAITTTLPTWARPPTEGYGGSPTNTTGELYVRPDGTWYAYGIRATDVKISLSWPTLAANT